MGPVKGHIEAEEARDRGVHSGTIPRVARPLQGIQDRALTGGVGHAAVLAVLGAHLRSVDCSEEHG